ncbi:MAG: hypothetical protein R2731_08160 [Nocardioides sp.]
MPPDSGSVAWAELPDPVARAGEATAVTAGFGYADAPELADGVFRVHVDPSRGGLVKLPVSWGQHAQLALRPTRSYDDLWASLTARWFGPLGGEVKGLTQPGDTGLVPLVKDADGAHLATPTVRWRARPARYAAAAALPGPYFLQLYAPAYDGAPELPPGRRPPGQRGHRRGLRSGAPAYVADAGAPPYVDGSRRVPAPAEPTPSGGTEPAPSARTVAAGQAGRAEVPVPVIAAVAGSAVLFAAAGLHLLRRGRRRPPAAPAPPGAGP